MNDNEKAAVDEAKEIVDKADSGPPDAVVNAVGKRCECAKSSRTQK